MYLALGMLKHVVPVQTLARWAWRAPRISDPDAVQLAIARVWRTQGLVNLGDRDCLQRSLLLYRELSRAGAAPTLMIGFRRSGDRTQGHAWVKTSAGTSAPAEGAAYVPAFCFGAGGELRPVQTDDAPAAAS
jgi:hypothetical protein